MRTLPRSSAPVVRPVYRLQPFEFFQIEVFWSPLGITSLHSLSYSRPAHISVTSQCTVRLSYGNVTGKRKKKNDRNRKHEIRSWSINSRVYYLLWGWHGDRWYEKVPNYRLKKSDSNYVSCSDLFKSITHFFNFKLLKRYFFKNIKVCYIFIFLQQNCRVTASLFGI